MQKFRSFLSTRAIFLFLLPVFFVLHGVIEHYDFVPATDALLLTAIYIIASLLLTGISWLLFRNMIKAAIYATMIMALHFFFGSIHDFLKSAFPGSFLSKYSFILPLLLVLFIIAFIMIRKWKKPLTRVTFFLNLALILFLVVDIVTLVSKAVEDRPVSDSLPPGFTDCKTCPKPDIYFILADEYAGPAALDSLFQFNDSAFINSLQDMGFRTGSGNKSNYNYTPFALASILDMEYLRLDGNGRGKTELAYCYRKIRENHTLRFLRSQGYAFYNYSVFDFEGQPARTRETFLPARTRLITAQTLLSRFDRDIRFNLVTRFKSKRNLEIITYANKKNNEHMDDLTRKIAESAGASPKFVYTHLMMPHYPYYYDSAGREQPFESLLEGKQVDQKAYISYLKYTNTRLLALVKHIRKHSTNPPVIILMGDHGFRHFTIPVKEEYYFQNFLSLHYPPNTSIPGPDSLSGVNVFRYVFNTVFEQKLPYLSDSTIYLAD